MISPPVMPALVRRSRRSAAQTRRPPSLAPLHLPPLIAGLAEQIALDLAAQALPSDQERRREHQTRIVLLLGEAVMRQVIGPVEIEIGAHGIGAEPLPGDFIEAPRFEQQAMGGVTHQDGKAELAPAEDHHGSD